MDSMSTPQHLEPELRWEKLNSTRAEKGWFNIKWEVHRARVPGGWLILARGEGSSEHSITYYPDPHHQWNGGSLP